MRHCPVPEDLASAMRSPTPIHHQRRHRVSHLAAVASSPPRKHRATLQYVCSAFNSHRDRCDNPKQLLLSHQISLQRHSNKQTHSRYQFTIPRLPIFARTSQHIRLTALPLAAASHYETSPINQPENARANARAALHSPSHLSVFTVPAIKHRAPDSRPKTKQNTLNL